MGTSQSSACRLLQEQNLHAYHLQKGQGLQPGNSAPHVQFVQGFLQWSIADPAFFAHVFFTDEGCFTWDRYINSRNSHIWDNENPHSVFVKSSPTEVFCKQPGCNFWWLSAGTCHFAAPAFQPGCMSTSEQHLSGTVDRERVTCWVASAITRINTPRIFSLGAYEEYHVRHTSWHQRGTDYANTHCFWTNSTETSCVWQSPTITAIFHHCKCHLRSVFSSISHNS